MHRTAHVSGGICPVAVGSAHGFVGAAAAPSSHEAEGRVIATVSSHS
jgi:hypothetical protein